MASDTDSADGREARAWRKRVLPLMVLILVAGAVLFAAVSVIEVRRLDQSLEDSVPRLEAIAEQAVQLSAAPASISAENRRFAVQVSLETYVTAQRYTLARTMLRARLWTRFMGFLTGMIMAMVGAAFVLGRLREEGSSFNSSGGGFSLSMTSASPGLILAGLGTLLMGLCLVVAPSVTTSDGAIYVPGKPTGNTADANAAEAAMNDMANAMPGAPAPLPVR
jgi:hypothetical protein